MKQASNPVRFAAVVAFVTSFLCAPSLVAQTTTWLGNAGDGDWNNPVNWDIGVPAEGTNAFIGGGNIANYNAPMVAGSFGGAAPGLSVIGILNVNASGFVIGSSETNAVIVAGAGCRLNVGAGGIMSITNGGLTIGPSGATTLSSGGSLSVSGPVSVGNGSGIGTMTNSGGVITAHS